MNLPRHARGGGTGSKDFFAPVSGPFGRVVTNPKGAVMPAFNPSTPLPCLGRFAEIWPVHADSVRGDVKFHPVTRKQAFEIWNRAREWERDSRKRGDRGGIIGYVGMRILAL